MTGWYAYDYRAGLDGIAPSGNVFQAAVPVGDEVWTNHYQWSIDDPETPDSVLALIREEQWVTKDHQVATSSVPGPNLHGTCVTFELRGGKLDLHGGQATLWVVSGHERQRWHTGPFDVTAEWVRHSIPVDEVEWRMSFKDGADVEPDLDAVLGSANSYGIAFVGFDQEPTGRLGMRGWRFGC